MNKLKILGLGASIVGAVATVVSSVVSEKQQANKIAEEVNKAVADLTNNK